MVKIIVRILFICIVTISLNFVYQVFFTFEKFNGKPVLFVPNTNIPIFIFISFIIGIIFEKFIMKSKWLVVLGFAFIMALIFYGSAKFIENKYAYIYAHYFQTTHNRDLTKLKEYSKTRDNYITLGQKLRKEGIKVKSIEGGYTERGYNIPEPESFRMKLYYINDDIYIIFDWDEGRISKKADKQMILDLMIEQQGEIDVHSFDRINYTAKSVTFLKNHGMSAKSYRLAPTKSNKFKFVED